MDLLLKDKVIIVTGGAKGIGAGISKVLAQESAIPFIVGRNESDNISTVKEIESRNGKAFFVTAELMQPVECKKAIESALQQFKERLNALMEESSNLKLIILANTKSEEMMIFKRNGCLWSEINPILDDLSFDKNMKLSYIKSYQ